MVLPPLDIDPVVSKLLEDVPELTTHLWNDKYRYYLPDGTTNESSIRDTKLRVAKGVCAKDPQKKKYEPLIAQAMEANLWIPGGRMLAGCGTGKRVTYINCYVNDDIDDDMVAIMEGVRYAAITQQQGGGIGTPYQFLRPRDAIVRRTGSISSGVIPFMRMWHAMCDTIMSSGSRRGAMMGTLSIDHPDLYRPELHIPEGRAKTKVLIEQFMRGEIKVNAIPVDFITAKQIPNELTNFNLSVLVSDSFMQSLSKDELWDLGFGIEPADPSKLLDTKKLPDGKYFYIYNRVPAKEIWEMILKSTYEHAEPGVLFIDRINEMNNLWYCEKINCTNPCGEQPLPKHGACDLGSINLALLVKHPFTNKAEINWKLLEDTTTLGMRFLDNILDVTPYPLEEQAIESRNKRRTGIGFMGLGTMLQMLGLRYGSVEAVTTTSFLVRKFRDAAYRASVELAKERGPFPLFDKEKYLQGKFIKKLPAEIREGISKHGIRNGVLMTLAPTGNTGIFAHYPSMSGEPDFDFDHTRLVLQADGTRRPYRVETFGWRAYKIVKGLDPKTTPRDVKLPDYMSTALDLAVDDHLTMQAACQEFIDASISKTINCPEDMNFEDFKHVYTKAYQLGLKGCTTYRPSGTRGAVLVSNTQEPKKELQRVEPTVKDRPGVLTGVTYKCPDGHGGSLFITVNADPETKKVFEVFVRDSTGNEYVEHAGRSISLLLRANVPEKEIRQQLKRSGGQLSIWYNGKGFTSQLQLLDHVVFDQAAKYFKTLVIEHTDEVVPEAEDKQITSKPCPECGSNLISSGGCLQCTECTYSKCG